MFKNKSEIYQQYRPDYPKDLVETLKLKSLICTDDLVAEFGSGTGKMTRLLLDGGAKVYAVEPDEEMFSFLKHTFANEPNLSLFNATAENCLLPSDSFDVVLCAQAFHLFDPQKAKQEFYRIIKQNGTIVLLWYFVDDSQPIAAEICNLFYSQNKGERFFKRQEISLDALRKIFCPNIVSYQIVSKFKQKFTNEQFVKSMLSSSYAPVESDTTYQNYTDNVQMIFEKYALENGMVEYDFQIHLYHVEVSQKL